MHALICKCESGLSTEKYQHPCTPESHIDVYEHEQLPFANKNIPIERFGEWILNSTSPYLESRNNLFLGPSRWQLQIDMAFPRRAGFYLTLSSQVDLRTKPLTACSLVYLSPPR